ncbi:MAG: hypothetical protein ABSB66_02020 [Candidatus Acidiferrales bacterium]|jgi:hypothetical protein
MKVIALIAASAAALTILSCGSSSPATAPAKSEAVAPAAPTPPAPAVPDVVQKAAELALGSETEVLLFGDLSKTGPQQVLAVNRLKATPPGVAPGTLVTRAVIIENDGNAWKQIFLCDEHLKNTKGFLGGSPLAPVNGWRLQYEQHEKGLEMYFTPIASPKGEGGHVLPVGIRWNPKVKRYQSLDRTFENFLGEVTTLETPESQIRQ